MSQDKITRRDLLQMALIGTGCVSAAHAADNRLSIDDTKAKSLGYVEDAAKVDAKRFPTYKAGQTCANCMLVQQRYGFWRPCTLFPGKLVSAKGWCSSWVSKTK